MSLFSRWTTTVPGGAFVINPLPDGRLLTDFIPRAGGATTVATVADLAEAEAEIGRFVPLLAAIVGAVEAAAEDARSTIAAAVDRQPAQILGGGR